MLTFDNPDSIVENIEVFVYRTHSKDYNVYPWSTGIKISKVYLPIDIELKCETQSPDVALKHAKQFWQQFFSTLSKSIEV